MGTEKFCFEIFSPKKNSFHGELARHRDNNRKDLLLKTGGHLGVTNVAARIRSHFRQLKASGTSLYKKKPGGRVEGPIFYLRSLGRQ